MKNMKRGLGGLGYTEVGAGATEQKARRRREKELFEQLLYPVQYLSLAYLILRLE